MGRLDSRALRQRIAAGNGEVIYADKAHSSYRPAGFERPVCRSKHKSKNSSGQVNWVKYAPPVYGQDSFHVLVVGDEQCGQAIRIALSAHLDFAVGYREVRSGKDALCIIGREAIDLIVFGCEVIDMDGLEFLNRLNQKCGYQTIPVIEMLDSGAARTGVQALKMGAHDYLLKDASGHHFEILPILVSRIHEEMTTQSALHRTASVQATLADSMPSVIYRLSLQGGKHDICINPEISEMGMSFDKWGCDAELHHQMCHEEDRPAVRQALELSYQTGAGFQCEYRINTQANTLCWFHDKAKVVMDKYGRPLFLQGVMTDITQYKLLETELAHYRAMLDKMVSQKTERLDRRVAILESCNSALSDNYGRIHQRYLDLLNSAQSGGIDAGQGTSV